MLDDISSNDDIILKININCLTMVNVDKVVLRTPEEVMNYIKIKDILDDSDEEIKEARVQLSEGLADPNCEMVIYELLPTECIREIVFKDYHQLEIAGSALINHKRIRFTVEPKYYVPTGSIKKCVDRWLWKKYGDPEGNKDYEQRYYSDYDQENIDFFNHLFKILGARRRTEHPYKMAIIGGGNGWELNAIEECLSKEPFDLECTIIDKIKWPLNHIDSCKYDHISNINFVKEDMFNYLQHDNLDYDVLYFSRCVNHTDMEGNTMILERLYELLVRHGITCAFAQIELKKEGPTKEFNKRFKEIFGFKSTGYLSNSVNNPRTSLYVREFN